MGKGRKTKVIAILALVVAVVGMSLGFAAFSNILTISSLATVTPNEEDFKMKAYGTTQVLTSLNDDDYEFFSNLSLYDSDTISLLQGGAGITGENAVIVNGEDGHINISNLSVNFTNSDSGLYIFAIKNEGMYDAYINISDVQNSMEDNGDIKKTCTPGEGTTPALVEEACNNLRLYILPISSSGKSIVEMPGYSFSSSYKLEPNDYFVFVIKLAHYNSSKKADGPFFVEFANIEFIFTTVPKGEILNP